MTKYAQREIALIKSSARDIDELNKLQRLENILMEEVVNKFNTVWILANKIDKIDDKLMEILYGKQ